MTKVREIKTYEEEEMEAADKMSKLLVMVAFILFLILTALLVCVHVANAEEISPDKAINCILGEARGEGYEAMLGHAEAIRNRGYLKGVYGCKYKPDAKERAYNANKGINSLASKAWAESNRTNTVKGAQYWGSLTVDKAWIKKMEHAGYVRTAVVRNTAFYRNEKE